MKLKRITYILGIVAIIVSTYICNANTVDATTLTDFVNYKGNGYVCFEEPYKNMSNIVGEFLFTTVPVRDNGMYFEGTDEEYAAVSEFDVYAVKGYSTDYRLCSYDKEKDIVKIYDKRSYSFQNSDEIIGENGLDLKNKFDETSKVRYYIGEKYKKERTLDDTKLIKQFIDSLENEPLVRFEGAKAKDKPKYEDSVTLKLTMKDKTVVNMTVYKEGYGYVNGYIPVDQALAQQVIALCKGEPIDIVDESENAMQPNKDAYVYGIVAIIVLMCISVGYCFLQRRD